MSATRYTYLGPEGTFTEAALRTLPEAATRELVPMVSVPAALDAVRNGEAAAALVPIENSVEGGVTATLDELASGEPLMIYREVLLPIAFALLVRPGHRAGRRQDGDRRTRSPSRRCATGWRRICRTPCGSRRPRTRTARGWCRRAASTRAFAGEFAAATYGLEPLVTEIHDAENATTRFVLVGRPARPAAPTGADKTSVVIWLGDDHPGALLELLQEFAVARGQPDADRVPADRRRASGSYCFSVDAEGHITDRRVGEALMGLQAELPECAVPRLVSAGGRGRRGRRPLRRGPRTRNSPRRRTGWPAARTAGPEPPIGLPGVARAL